MQRHRIEHPYILTFILILCLLLVFSLYEFQQSQNAYAEKPSSSVAVTSAALGNASGHTAAIATSSITHIPMAEEIPLPKPPAPKFVAKPVFLATTEAALSVYSENGVSKIMYQKNAHERLLIASITKLMTALVVKKYIPEDATITISDAAVAVPSDAGHLKVGQTFTRDELLYPLLIESSNDAAYAFAEKLGSATFIQKMNNLASDIGMSNTHFTNPSGLDEEGSGGNYSTAADLVLLAQYILKNYTSIFILTMQPKYHLVTADKSYDYTLVSTDTALTDTRIPYKIIGGKTGETVKAKQALLLVTLATPQEGYLINIVLHSDNRKEDMVALVNSVYNSLK